MVNPPSSAIADLDVCQEFCRYSLEKPDDFWAEQARFIDWETPFQHVCDYSQPPFAKWFTGGRTNICHNAVDRHLATRGDQPAIYYISSETGEQRTLTYRDLHHEVLRMASCLRALGLNIGDRVVLYLPMIPEAAVAMLACLRLGIIHSTVFAGFAAPNLATRIDSCDAKLVITCDAATRGSKHIPLKHLVDEALDLAERKVSAVLMINRGLDTSVNLKPGRDYDYSVFADECAHNATPEKLPCVWLEANDTSYVLYTSGTTARPKGIQRDTGGYAVAIAASMHHIFGGRPGETFFSTADVGWVVGHSYTVYAPLICGMSTVMYEGTPLCEDGAVWWRIVEQTGATVMFASPTAIRVLKKQAAQSFTRHNLGTLRHLFLAGEPLDETTSIWIRETLKHVEIVDNYWQTETGWPLLSMMPGIGPIRVKPGSPGFPVYGYKLEIVDADTGLPVPRGEKGVLTLGLPLPPGCMPTVWQNDAMFERHYCGQFPGTMRYSTFDYAVQDDEGYYFILGRTDDVINVAGHRLGTREIEEAASSHPAVAEVAAVGVHDEIKGQAVICFVTLKRPDEVTSNVALNAISKE
ncbi:MAG TPA: AMP-binding protein, partial [Candidatus Methylacidiphilales bacterium]|nr:AMP-binding protein [Candidatus Methylacidiphilales bacterium]